MGSCSRKMFIIMCAWRAVPAKEVLIICVLVCENSYRLEVESQLCAGNGG